ncbi:MAG: hypothetical protein M1118_01640, partial [Chloroflexi bacterium]|nr:hypothetical protein [Chloroflexota bacterium]
VYFASAAIWALIAIPGVVLFNWPALVLANTAMNCAHAVILFTLLVRREPLVLREQLLRTWLRGLAAAGVMAAVCLLTTHILATNSTSNRAGEFVEILVTGVLGATAYISMLLVISRDEVQLVRNSLRR